MRAPSPLARILTAVTFGAVLAGGAAFVVTGTSEPSAPPPADTPTVAEQADVPVPPLGLRIPDLDVEVPLDTVGLNPDGTVEVPPVTSPEVAALYDPPGPAVVLPGDAGPSVVLGHVSGRPDGAPDSIPGVFHALADLDPGDTVETVRDGQVTVWRVERVETHDKTSFPTADVYGDVDSPALRLVTCGGAWVGGAIGFSDNVIAFAVPA